MAVVCIGIGSNLGDRERNCLDALGLMEQNGIAVLVRSATYETSPWGVTDQPDFINMAVEAGTDLSPLDLLRLLKKIEREMGRTNEAKWGPRIIDLDILLYDDLVLDSEELVIPHPLMLQRDFVLRPLAEIAPDRVHPVMKKTLKGLLQEA